jgi:DNA topoisomerase-1
MPRDKSADDVDVDYALKLLALPREVGQHPETGKMITAGIGRYGPFVLHDGVYANLENTEEVFDVGINRAVMLIAEKVSGGGRGFRRGGAQVLKDLGEHPGEGGKIQVLNGRYGPYVKHGKVNATVPKGKDPEKLTVEEAVQLIEERAAKSGAKKKAAPKKKAAAKKTATKKTAAKKAPAKKAAAKKTAAKKTGAKKTPAEKAQAADAD